MPQLLDRTSPMPLWAQLAAELRRRCASGEFDGTLPGEHHLAEEYRVSRHTVRAALRALRDEGILTAGRGRGTMLAHQGFAAPLGTMYSLFRSIEARGIVQRSEVRRLEVVRDAAVAERLGLAADTDLVLLARRRLADDEPLAVDSAWIPAAIARPLLGADFSRTALYDELAARCGVVPDSGREQVSPVLPPAGTCSDLGLPPGTPAFRLERLTRAAGRPLEWRETWVRADRFHVVAEWSAASPLTVGVVGLSDPEQRW